LTRWIVLAGVAVSLLAAAVASAQERLAVRALASTTDGGFTRTALVGAGVGVDAGEFFEVIAEGAIAPGVDYPPSRIIPAGPAGPPFTFVVTLIEEDRVDRYLLGGVRLLAPTDVVRPFGELTVGWRRDVTVQRNPFTAAPESLSSTGAFVSLGGGVEVRLRSRVELFAGYRYARDPRGELAFHAFHGGVGLGFGAP
jgi:hypothetical protein